MDPYVMLAQALWFLKPNEVGELVECAVSIVSRNLANPSPESPSASDDECG